MSDYIYQLTQQSCSFCGQSGVWPRENTYEDPYTQEIVTEASYVCHKCGNKFYEGEVSRTKARNEKE